MSRPLLIAWFAVILLSAGCAGSPSGERACPACAPCPKCADTVKREPERARYVPAGYDTLPGWREANAAQSLAAFRTGCAKIPSTSPLRPACTGALALTGADDTAARAFFERSFTPYALIAPDGATEGLVTGYYEPVIAGSSMKTAAARHPVYGVPADLVTVDLAEVHPQLRGMRLRGRIEGRRLVPYPSRAQIEARDALPAPVLAWVHDAVELFFLHIQGSGQVALEDGTRIRIGYADQNGHPYRSLGAHLVARGEMTLEQVSMQSLKAWARANPDRLAEALASNPSYVFFRELPARDGPIGALGVPLRAGHSIAVDRRFVTLGAPVYLATRHPGSGAPLERLVVAQDTGGAIRGAIRADLFWGSGSDAGEPAGRMREQGRMWLLWPSSSPAPQ